MPEQNEITLSWWVVSTDKGEYKLSEKEMEMLLVADQRGDRFVMFDGFMLNTAFIKEANRKRQRKNPKFETLTGDEKYILENRKQLE